jgi:hypothetical protein
MATMVLLSLWVTRREHSSGLRRLTGRKDPSRQPSRAAAGPALMQAPPTSMAAWLRACWRVSGCASAPSACSKRRA